MGTVCSRVPGDGHGGGSGSHGHRLDVPGKAHMKSSHRPGNPVSSTLPGSDLVAKMQNIQLTGSPSATDPAEVDQHQLMETAGDEDDIQKVENGTSPTLRIVPENGDEQLVTDAGDEEYIKEVQNFTSLPQNTVPQNNNHELMILATEGDGYINYDECPTCLEGYDNENPRITTRCKHHFHLSCILEWMERKNTCPMCDQEMVYDEAYYNCNCTSVFYNGRASLLSR